MIALYFAQGIREEMLYYGIPAWMAILGKSAGEITSFAVASGLPWSFKFIIATLMNRYTILSIRRKSSSFKQFVDTKKLNDAMKK